MNIEDRGADENKTIDKHNRPLATKVLTAALSRSLVP